MYDVRELMPGIHQIHCQGEDRYGLGDGRTVMYAAWFLAGPPAAIIEPGPTSVAEVLLQAIRDLGYDPQAVEMVAATHIHVDHAGGLGYLARELPRARFAVHHRGVRHMADPARLVASTTATFDPHWEEVFGPIDAVPADRLLAVDNGDQLALAGRLHRVIYTPGHAPHHVSLYDEETGLLYCGEALGLPLPGLHTVAPVASPPAWDLEAALASVDKLGRLDSQAICYSHVGDVGLDPRTAIEFANKCTKDMATIIRQALAKGVDREELNRRLCAYAFNDANYPYRFDLTIAGFDMYFQRIREDS
ncbi:MAG TPA: MBL fold metallo-hydrolase [Dehalococcoidia bacterium]|nr:MBL fold metallo-hydrolase [Dehalococcoidia bacterium]